MPRFPQPASIDLRGRTVVITRPAGTGGALARQVAALGGVPLRLPGLALRGERSEALCAALQSALGDALLLFTSPAAVRYAAALGPLRTRATVLAVGQGTARALQRQGLAAQAPARQDSEGLLDMPALQRLAGRRVALVGADGGRGLLRATLRERGARLREVHVYRRVPPRLDRRHLAPLAGLRRGARVLLSSAEALGNLERQLPPALWRRLCGATAVVSSERLAVAARAAGFARIELAASARPADLLAAAAR
ncbi:uroporphyrinogen-III synthase [Frateuria defendens]|uniref:uroporphyrinogen-III synthase n=1 Tax=Frateuria defendens TaxID=2219559 RepID=UPI00066FD14A|nr:uroporphyrinogen-III synthase [Frateuria defendens]